MRYTKSFALMLLLAAGVTNISFAQSNESDPLDTIDELNQALSALQSDDSGENTEDNNEQIKTTSETDVSGAVASETILASESSSESSLSEETATESTETSAKETTSVNELQAKSIIDRLSIKEIPAGKEHHLLYTMPGTIDYRGMTFMRINSPRFFNRFQKCNVAESDTITKTLSRLKISQGAPLECRESMKYQFLPYKTFRATR